VNENLEAEIWSLVCFILISAANLEQERKEYGPLRLLETASRLVNLLRENGVTSNRLNTIQTEIDANKFSVMTDEVAFSQFLQNLALEIVDYL
jgi:hypothetical protein